MKRTVLSVLIATASLTATAQAPEAKKKHAPKATFGIQGGANMNTVTGKAYGNGDKLDNNFIVGFHLGLNVEIPLSKAVFLQPGIQAITKGAKKKTSTYTTTQKYYYLEMPVHVIFKPQAGSGHFIAGIGANLAYGISGSWKYDEVVGYQNDREGKMKFKNSWNPNTPNPDGDQYVRPIDLSASLILGYQLKNNLYFQLKGQYSVLNITPDVQGTPSGFVQGNAKNLNVGLSVGFRF